MEKRPYFIAGDLLACLLTGALAGWWAVDGSRFGLSGLMAMGIAMVIGMLKGMGAGLLLGMFFTPLFGAMELMLPVMLAGMVPGMVVGMASVMVDITTTDASGLGAMIGVACLAVIYVMNAVMRGEVKP